MEKYSVVVVTFNNLEKTANCISSILKYRSQETELIVVDNGSRDDTKEEIAKIVKNTRNVVTLFLEKNYGAGYARNEGLRVAKGRYIIFCDNDTEWTGDVISSLMNGFKNKSDVGIVGMCGLYVFNEKLQIHLHSTYVKDVLDVTAVPSYCMMLDRSKIKKDIQFDLGYKMYQWEDTDFCMQISKLNYRIVVAPSVPLLHNLHGTSKLINKDEFLNILKDNHEYFISKWENYINIKQKHTLQLLFDTMQKYNYNLIYSHEENGFKYYDLKPADSDRI